MRKAEAEEKWVEQVLEVGVENYAKMYENRKMNWCFFLKNGAQRFWSDISEANQRKLGVAEEDIE